MQRLRRARTSWQDKRPDAAGEYGKDGNGLKSIWNFLCLSLTRRWESGGAVVFRLLRAKISCFMCKSGSKRRRNVNRAISMWNFSHFSLTWIWDGRALRVYVVSRKKIRRATKTLWRHTPLLFSWKNSTDALTTVCYCRCPLSFYSCKLRFYSSWKSADEGEYKHCPLKAQRVRARVKNAHRRFIVDKRGRVFFLGGGRKQKLRVDMALI